MKPFEEIMNQRKNINVIHEEYLYNKSVLKCGDALEGCVWNWTDRCRRYF
jgi:hypothetical protein